MSTVVRRTLIATIAALSMLVSVGSAAGDHEVDEGAVHTGVSSEDEARAYPCPGSAGEWERSGPVVCLAKRAGSWELHWEQPEDEWGCTHDATGWHGSCVFDLDMGDHIRVWGTRGIAYTPFTVAWSHGAPPPSEEPSSPSPTTPSPDPTGSGEVRPSEATPSEPTPSAPASRTTDSRGSWSPSGRPPPPPPDARISTVDPGTAAQAAPAQRPRGPGTPAEDTTFEEVLDYGDAEGISDDPEVIAAVGTDDEERGPLVPTLVGGALISASLGLWWWSRRPAR